MRVGAPGARSSREMDDRLELRCGGVDAKLRSYMYSHSRGDPGRGRVGGKRGGWGKNGQPVEPGSEIKLVRVIGRVSGGGTSRNPALELGNIIGGGFVTPRVHSGLTYPGTRARDPLPRGGWFPNTRGLRPCLT